MTSTTLGAKVPVELGELVDKAILAHPARFQDRSEFVRTAIRLHLGRLGFHEEGCTDGPVNLQTQGDGTSRALEELPAVNRKEKRS